MSNPATDVQTPRVQPPNARNLPTREGEEVWAIQVPGSVTLRVSQPNRYGQLVDALMTIGPNRPGFQFRIKSVDREENQARMVDPDHDPFRNGMLVRIDASQQDDPATASTDALTTEDLLDIFDLDGPAFTARIASLGEMPLRRLFEVGQSMDASHRQITEVQEVIADRYTKGGPQTTMDTGERLS